MTTPVDTSSQDGWRHCAVVDPLDHGAVLALVRIADVVESYSAAYGWQPDQTLARAVGSTHPPMLVELSDDQLRSVLDQIGGPLPEATPAEAVEALTEAFRAARGRDSSQSITFGTGTGTGVYVQWLDMQTHVTVEVSANEYLPRHLRLAFADELRVLESPMVPPGLLGPNWGYAITTDDQYAKAAAAVVRALAVFGVRPVEILAALNREPTRATQGQTPKTTPTERAVDTAGKQNSVKTPEDVFDALREYEAGTMSWEEVKAAATGVKYGKPEPSSWGDALNYYVTFNDAVMLARAKKVILPEQEAELAAVGRFE